MTDPRLTIQPEIFADNRCRGISHRSRPSKKSSAYTARSAAALPYKCGGDSLANIEIKIVEDPCVPVMLGYRPELDDPARPLLTITSVTRRRSIHMSEKQKPTPEELRARLTDEQFQVTQKAGTEASRQPRSSTRGPAGLVSGRLLQRAQFRPLRIPATGGSERKCFAQSAMLIWGMCFLMARSQQAFATASTPPP
jgi:hypothetical protein